MFKLVAFLGLGLTAVSFSDCNLITPIDLGTSDPRAPISYDKRITISEVEMDPRPDFSSLSQDLNPPPSNTLAVELFSPEGICQAGVKPLGMAFGLTADCARAHEQGAWTPRECMVDFLEFGHTGFAHVNHLAAESSCSSSETQVDDVKTFTSEVIGFGGKEKVVARMKGNLLTSLEMTLQEKTYCVLAGKRVTPHRYGP